MLKDLRKLGAKASVKNRKFMIHQLVFEYSSFYLFLEVLIY